MNQKYFLGGGRQIDFSTFNQFLSLKKRPTRNLTEGPLPPIPSSGYETASNVEN